jgi:NAD(P)-dependent dehydrogenase (short-subunit alcohol dehydrogenase family)
MYELHGRNALITGAAHGIGQAIALRLADEGCNVAIFDRDADAAEKTAEAVRQKGRKAAVATGDIGDEQSVSSGMAALIREIGHVDILVNNAGILRVGKLIESSVQDWRDSFSTNVDGVFWSCRAVLPHMVERRSGCVVNTASWLGKRALANYSSYCATKFAVVALTQSLALEMAEHGIRVNAVGPGIIVDTRMREESEEMHKRQGLPLAAERAKTIPLGRLGYPNDVARVVAFLASDEADYMTGQTVNVTGGLWLS